MAIFEMSAENFAVNQETDILHSLDMKLNYFSTRVDRLNRLKGKLSSVSNSEINEFYSQLEKRIQERLSLKESDQQISLSSEVLCKTKDTLVAIAKVEPAISEINDYIPLLSKIKLLHEDVKKLAHLVATYEKDEKFINHLAKS